MKRVGVPAFLVLLAVVLYRKVVRLWWTYDDAYLLHLSIDHTLFDAFFNASVWPQKLFTPLVNAVYEGNLRAFGLEPERWFVVHLVFVAASAIAFYFALRLWFEVWPAAVGAVLFLASVPLCSLVTEISGIHYFLSILFGSLATIAYVRALRGDRFALTLVAALLYLTAMLAKEIVTPLVFLLVVLPERDTRTRLRFAAPLGVTLVLYFIWRRLVIGTLLGGYGWATDRGEWPMLLATLPKKIILASAGVNVALGVALIVLMTVGVVLAAGRRPFSRRDGGVPDAERRRPRRLSGERPAPLTIFIVALALATGPILPVSKEMQRRYALMPWLCWSVAFVAGARRYPKVLLTVVPLLMLVVNRQEWGYEFGRTQRMSDEARFFFDMPPDSYLRRPLVPPAAMGELNWLKTAHIGKPGGALWFYDDYFLCTADVADKRAWEYAPERRAVVEISLQPVREKHCGSIREDVPLFADFEYREGSLFWTFGPYTDGQYRVLIANGLQAFDVPRKDGFRASDIPGITLRVRYDSPQGWTTYSPEIALDFAKEPKKVWRRGN